MALEPPVCIPAVTQPLRPASSRLRSGTGDPPPVLGAIAGRSTQRQTSRAGGGSSAKTAAASCSPASPRTQVKTQAVPTGSPGALGEQERTPRRPGHVLLDEGKHVAFQRGRLCPQLGDADWAHRRRGRDGDLHRLQRQHLPHRWRMPGPRRSPTGTCPTPTRSPSTTPAPATGRRSTAATPTTTAPPATGATTNAGGTMTFSCSARVTRRAPAPRVHPDRARERKRRLLNNQHLLHRQRRRDRSRHPSPGRCSCSGKVQLVRRPVLGGLGWRSTMDAPELRMTGNRPVAEV